MEPVFQAMSRAAQGFHPFQLWLEGVGGFPNLRQPRVLWAGAAGDLEALGLLQQGVDQEIAKVGFQLERRGFNPHITLGRVRDSVTPPQRRKIGEIMSRIRLPDCDAWTASEVVLFQTHFTDHGTVHTPIASAPLAGGG